MGFRGEIQLKHIPRWGGIDLIAGLNVTGEMLRHIHDHCCIGIVETGRRMTSFEAYAITTEPGGIWLISPGKPHSCHSFGELHSYKAICFHFEYLQEYFQLPKSDDIIDAQTFKNKENYKDLLDLYQSLWNGSFNNAEQKLLNIVQRMASLAAIKASPIKQEPCITKILSYLEEHVSAQTSIATLATLAGWNSSYLERRFRKSAGLPIHAYHKALQMKEAKSMLREGRTLAFVAAELGFADQSHLTKAFKDWVGITPGRYLKAYH